MKNIRLLLAPRHSGEYDIIILFNHICMTTISVPLTADLLQALESFIRHNRGRNKADVMRRALEKYLEDQAVEAVLQAQREPSLRGNFDDLLKKF